MMFAGLFIGIVGGFLTFFGGAGACEAGSSHGDVGGVGLLVGWTGVVALVMFVCPWAAAGVRAKAG